MNMYQEFANDAVVTLNEVGMDAVMIVSQKTMQSDKPWITETNDGLLVNLRCIFTKNKEKSINGSLAQEGDILCVALPTKPSLMDINVINNAHILRDNIRWNVVGYEVLKPTNVEILYRFLLRK